MVQEEMVAADKAYREHKIQACKDAGAMWVRSAQDGSKQYLDCTPDHAVGDGEGFKWVAHVNVEETLDTLRHVYHCAWSGNSTRRAFDYERDAFFRGAYEEAATCR